MSEPFPLPDDCPCGGFIVERGGVKYCTECGKGLRAERAVGRPMTATEVKDRVLAVTVPRPTTPREEALSRLSGIRSDLHELAREFTFEIPKRVEEILSIAEEVIKSRYGQG